MNPRSRLGPCRLLCFGLNRETAPVYTDVAQSVEHRFHVPGVIGSSPIIRNCSMCGERSPTAGGT